MGYDKTILLLLCMCVPLVGTTENKTANSTSMVDLRQAMKNSTVNVSMVTCSPNCSSNMSNASNHVKYPGAPGYIMQLFLIGNKLILVVSSIGVFTNTTLILLILIDPLKRLQKGKTSIIIISVALADLLTSISSIFYSHPSKNINYVTLFDALIVGYTASTFTLLVFTMERFVATIYPLKISQIVTTRKTICACLLAWFSAIVIGTNGFYNKEGRHLEKRRIARIAILEIVVVAMIILNIIIIVTLHQRAKRFRMIRSSTTANRKQRQLNTVLTSLVILFIFTAFPFLIVTHIYHIVIGLGSKHPNTAWRSFLRYFPRLFMPIGLLNYILNPVIYAWRLRDYRNSLVALCRKRKLTIPSSLVKTKSSQTAGTAGETD